MVLQCTRRFGSGHNEMDEKSRLPLVTIGFESGNQQILNNIHKGITTGKIRKFVKNTNKAENLMVHGRFMMGNPGETKETMEETLKLSQGIKL